VARTTSSPGCRVVPKARRRCGRKGCSEPPRPVLAAAARAGEIANTVRQLGSPSADSPASNLFGVGNVAEGSHNAKRKELKGDGSYGQTVTPCRPWTFAISRVSSTR
jgi:hypothetical protein